MFDENVEKVELENLPEGDGAVDARLDGLQAKVAGKKGRVDFKKELEEERIEQAEELNEQDVEETRKFWAQFFGEGLIASVLTKICVWGCEVKAGDLDEGGFWKNVKKFEKELKEEGIDAEDRIGAHRLNSVEKIKRAVERGEKQVEFDVRIKGGKLYLSHDPGMPTQDRDFDAAMTFLNQHPDVQLMIDIKELSAAKHLTKNVSKYPVLSSGRIKLMSHNPHITNFLSQSKELPGVPLVFHYVPLSKTPFPVRTAVKALGGVGTKRVADMIDSIYPGSFYGAGTHLAVNESWEELKAKKNADEMYTSWDTFPPDDLINEMKATGRQVWISVPHELVPDGMREWADERGLKLLLHGAKSMQETGEALENPNQADMVMSDSAEEVDQHLGEGLQDAA